MIQAPDQESQVEKADPGDVFEGLDLADGEMNHIDREFR